MGAQVQTNKRIALHVHTVPSSGDKHAMNQSTEL